MSLWQMDHNQITWPQVTGVQEWVCDELLYHFMWWASVPFSAEYYEAIAESIKIHLFHCKFYIFYCFIWRSHNTGGIYSISYVFTYTDCILMVVWFHVSDIYIVETQYIHIHVIQYMTEFIHVKDKKFQLLNNLMSKCVWHL